MTKRWTALLTALVLLCAAAGARAESAGVPDLYDLYEVKDSGKTWICSVVPVADGVTVASAAGRAFTASSTCSTVASGELQSPS